MLMYQITGYMPPHGIQIKIDNEFNIHVKHHGILVSKQVGKRPLTPNEIFIFKELVDKIKVCISIQELRSSTNAARQELKIKSGMMELNLVWDFIPKDWKGIKELIEYMESFIDELK
jgi:hypothetical protein